MSEITDIDDPCVAPHGCPPPYRGHVFAPNAHCSETPPCHLCMTRRSNNRMHIGPLPTWYFDVPMNIPISVVEYGVPNWACIPIARLGTNQ